ncbi:MAG: alpha/beta hydrolase [Magnetococcales bacterium]|nr:alpha/beta hydrolase [Magnetococcales bacterium]
MAFPRPFRPGRVVAWLSLVLLAGYVGVGGYLFFFQNRMVFHPGAGIGETPETWGMPYENVFFASGRERLNGWWMPGRAGEPLLLFFHGNTRVLSGLRPHIELFSRLGLELFLFDYRGYGLSTGHPTEAGVYADALAAREYLTTTRKIDPARLIYYGHSLGGGAATWLAARHPPGGLILEGSFTSIPDVGAGRYPFLPIHLMSRIHFDNLSLLPSIHAPLLIIHSRDDVVIPFQHALNLFAAANEPKSLLETRGHHDTSFHKGGKTAEEGLTRFLAAQKKQWKTEPQ